MNLLKSLIVNKFLLICILLVGVIIWMFVRANHLATVKDDLATVKDDLSSE